MTRLTFRMFVVFGCSLVCMPALYGTAVAEDSDLGVELAPAPPAEPAEQAPVAEPADGEVAAGQQSAFSDSGTAWDWKLFRAQAGWLRSVSSRISQETESGSAAARARPMGEADAAAVAAGKAGESHVVDPSSTEFEPLSPPNPPVARVAKKIAADSPTDAGEPDDSQKPFELATDPDSVFDPLEQPLFDTETATDEELAPIPRTYSRHASSYCSRCSYTHQFLPDGLMYKSYVAGEKEPRFASQWLHESGRGLIWESALGGRVGLYRWGTRGAVNPQGLQWDLEGAVFSRLDPDQESDLDAADFRFGTVLTRRCGPTAWKVGYYHISSHLGDEFMIRNPNFDRVNYVRDAALVGVIHNITPDVGVYFEAAYSPAASGGAEPLELQFGTQYAPAIPSGRRGDPFAAVNVHLREEFDFGGSVNVLAGWQWRSAISDRTLRVGLQHYNGKSMQYSFFDESESLTGLGLWLDY